MGIRIGNCDERFPDGDLVQTVECCEAPTPLAGLTDDTVTAILTEIDQGLPNGQRYASHHSAAPERQAWRVVQKFTDPTPEQAKEIVKQWLKKGILVLGTARDPVTRHDTSGLSVNWDAWRKTEDG